MPAARNRLLLVAIAVQLVLLAIFLAPLLGGLLGQTFPDPLGLLCAMAIVPALLLVDALFKARRRRRVGLAVRDFDGSAGSEPRRWRRPPAG